MRENADATRFEIEFAPMLDLVGRVRHFVSDFYTESLGDPEVTSRIAVAAHELLENAVKYASHCFARICIVVAREEDGAKTVTIETQNRALTENLDAVRETLDDLATSPDAMTSYQRLLDRCAKRATGSGLGLGRVLAEADMKLTYEIRQDELTIRAQTRLEPGAMQ
jgi:hypothetical protein